MWCLCARSCEPAAWHAFDTFVKAIPKEELEPLVVPLRRAIEGTGTPGIPVPGFSLTKGVAPFVPIIIAGLTTGSKFYSKRADSADHIWQVWNVSFLLLSHFSSFFSSLSNTEIERKKKEEIQREDRKREEEEKREEERVCIPNIVRLHLVFQSQQFLLMKLKLILPSSCQMIWEILLIAMEQVSF